LRHLERIGGSVVRMIVVERQMHGRRVSTWEAKNDPVTERYRYLYGHTQLRQWIPAVREIAHQVAAVHLTFNNNHANYATTNALEMAQFLSE
jgi:uncharacterized protein YecE (DUF72 family)